MDWKYSLNGAWCFDCKTFWASTFCFPCLSSKARTWYDGSSLCFNCWCVPNCTIRNIVRSGFGISGSSAGDVGLSICCPCCSAAQTLLEVYDRVPETMRP